MRVSDEKENQKKERNGSRHQMSVIFFPSSSISKEETENSNEFMFSTSLSLSLSLYMRKNLKKKKQLFRRIKKKYLKKKIKNTYYYYYVALHSLACFADAGTSEPRRADDASRFSCPCRSLWYWQRGTNYLLNVSPCLVFSLTIPVVRLVCAFVKDELFA